MSRTLARALFALLLALSCAAPAGAFLDFGVSDSASGGHSVAFTTDISYEVDPALEYLGSYTHSRLVKAENALKQEAEVYTFAVFAKRAPETGEASELFIVSWRKLPSGWRASKTGELATSFYDFKPERFTGLAAFLDARKIAHPGPYFGGMPLGYGSADRYTRFYYAVRAADIPQGADRTAHLLESFRANVKPKAR